MLSHSSSSTRMSHENSINIACPTNAFIKQDDIQRLQMNYLPEFPLPRCQSQEINQGLASHSPALHLGARG
jgi:hypothetical protein